MAGTSHIILEERMLTVAEGPWCQLFFFTHECTFSVSLGDPPGQKGKDEGEETWKQHQ